MGHADEDAQYLRAKFNKLRFEVKKHRPRVNYDLIQNANQYIFETHHLRQNRKTNSSS